MAALTHKEEQDSYTTFFNRICCFDTETTALDTSKAKVIEISLRDINGNNVLTKLVDPLETIENAHIHHITNELIAENDGETFDNIIPEMESWVEQVYGKDKIVYMLAHNNIYYDKHVRDRGQEENYSLYSLKTMLN